MGIEIQLIFINLIHGIDWNKILTKKNKKYVFINRFLPSLGIFFIHDISFPKQLFLHNINANALSFRQNISIISSPSYMTKRSNISHPYGWKHKYLHNLIHFICYHCIRMNHRQHANDKWHVYVLLMTVASIIDQNNHDCIRFVSFWQ